MRADERVLFLFDEHPDWCSAAEVWKQVDIFMNAVHDTAKPSWVRILSHSTRTFQQRFMQMQEEFLQGSAQQAEHWCRSYTRDFDSYMQVQWRTVGTLPSFWALDMNLDMPDEIMQHAMIRPPQWRRLAALSRSSWRRARLTCRERWTGSRLFNQLYRVIPRWGGRVDMDVQPYLNDVAHFTIGNVHWSYENEGYFGPRELEVKESRKMHLIPEQGKVSNSSRRIIEPVVVDENAISHGHTATILNDSECLVGE
ncbi:hypothetical protein F4809DRAFT_644964 [Biscogniauxia mediterranea]|nr:hypothetical protein F4809DRAFT_644964 [Biscogniauxia mediterranea]